MEKLKRIIEESALKAMMVDTSDLQGLADLHTHLQRIAQCTGELTDSAAKPLQIAHPASAAAADLIEKIILQEVKDTEGTLQTIRDTVQTLQKLIGQVAGGGSGSDIVFPPGLPLPKTAGHPAAPQKKTVGGITLPDNVDEAILREFLTNQPDVLANLEVAILTTEQNPSKANRNAIKGILHNLKGESSLLGLQEMSAVCHRTESLLVDESKPIPVEQLLAAKDWLQKTVAALNQHTNPPAEAAVEEKPLFDAPIPMPQETTAAPAADVNTGDLTVAEGDVPLALEFVQESNEHLESAEAHLLKIEENNSDTEVLNAIFRAFHTIKGVAGFLNLKPIGILAHAAENLLDLARKGKMILEGEKTDIVFESIDAMKKMIHSLGESLGKDRRWQAYEKLEDLISRLKTLTGIDVTAAPAVRPSAPIRTDPSKSTTSAPAFKESGASAGAGAQTGATVTAESTVKVTTVRLDSLINTVGELVIAQSMVSQDITSSFSQNPRLERNVRHLDKITRSLQELSMSMRMVPVQGVFQKMARLVRDLSRKAGKEIELTCVGSETEMDRNVVEAIGDPLVHMVRNSVDHGVEPPDEREKAGKPRCGHVELKAFHQGGNVVIRISDDGRGLNRERLVQKAIDQGIIKSGQELTDQEIDRLIFHAGLSTAQKITDISGRGVGMDVVRKNIEMLRGRIDIDSAWGKGTTFTIRLPLTLAVIDGQIAGVGGEKFIVPIISIEQSLRPKREQISTVRGRAEMVMIRGNLLPLVRLHRLFNIQPRSLDPCESLVMVVGDGDERYCLLVDDLLGQQQVVIKSLGGYFNSIPGVSGGAIMGDGLVRLILDIPALLQAAQQKNV